MGLNIRNADVERDIRALAALKGQSLTEAVGEAVRAELARSEKERAQEEHERTREKPFKDVWEMLEHFQSLPKSPTFTSDHSDLYDENGEPIW